MNPSDVIKFINTKQENFFNFFEDFVMKGKFKIVKKYIDEYDYYGLLRDGAPDDEFISLIFSTVTILNRLIRIALK